MSSDPEILKELLLEDYRYRAEALRSSEQVGETRLNLFIGLATLLLGALVSLSTGDNAPKGDSLKFIALVLLFVLFGLGLITLQRLIKRNKNTDKCKDDLDYIRQTYKDLFDEEGQLNHYYPIGDLLTKKQSCACGRTAQDLREFGGLSHSMSAINSFLLASFVFCVFSPFDQDIKITSSTTLVPLIRAIVTGILAFIVQVLYINHCENKANDERKNIKQERDTIRLSRRVLTHAGGVVCRTNNNITEYLVISSKQVSSGEWVLPKGHIESHESPAQAALREVYEETGIVARLMCPLDVVEYTTSNEFVRAKFYLMEELSIENRQMQWLTFDQAKTQLNHKESRHLLILAECKHKELSNTFHRKET